VVTKLFRATKGQFVCGYTVGDSGYVDSVAPKIKRVLQMREYAAGRWLQNHGWEVEKIVPSQLPPDDAA